MIHFDRFYLQLLLIYRTPQHRIKDSNYAVNDQDFHWVVVHEFERHGWSVQDVYLGNPMRHDEKYLLINQGFSRKQRLTPYFNRQMLCK